MHDPFHPRFSTSVSNSRCWVVPQVKGDAWCLGYFVDNELSWGGSVRKAAATVLAWVR